MQWIILFSGLAMLLILSRKKRPTIPTYRRRSFEGEPESCMEAAANGTKVCGMIRERIMANILPQFERSIRYMDRFSAIKPLPAAELLCTNSLFLHEQVLRALRNQHKLPRLPRSAHGCSRISAFAETLLLSHDFAFTAEDMEASLSVWQKSAPLTETELHSLPQVMQFRLLEELCLLALECASDQRAYTAAHRCHSMYTRGQKRTATKILRRFACQPVFCEALLSWEASRDWMNGISQEWLDNPEPLIEKERLRQSEIQRMLSNIIHSLRLLEQAPWETLLENVSIIHRLLKQDSVYMQMDAESRRYYRIQAAKTACTTRLPESSLCKGVLELCKRASAHSVAAHAGYYLLDEGYPLLLSHLHRLSFMRRVLIFFQKRMLNVFRVLGWLLFGSLFVLGFRWKLPIALLIPFALIFTLSIQQAVLCLIPSKPQKLPRIAVKQLSPENQILVVCPVVLTNPQQAVSAVKHLSVMHAANQDHYLHFLMVGDFQDSLTAALSTDAGVITAAASAIKALCDDTGHSFLYLQRERSYSSTEKTYLCRERKHGALELVLRLISGRSVQDHLAFSTFDPSSLKGKYRYVIVVDSDTVLSPGSVLHMAGALMHPLQKRQYWNQKMRGVSIIQPCIDIPLHAYTTVFSRLTSTDESSFPAKAMNRLFSAGGTFEGVGIIEPESFLDETTGAVPEGKLLDPFPVEAALAGCASADAIKLYKSTCTNLHQWTSRLHKRTRSIWHLLPYTLPLNGLGTQKAIRTSERFRIWYDAAHTLATPIQLLMLIYASFSRRELLLAIVALLPGMHILFKQSANSILQFLYRLSFLPCEAFIRADAIVRALYRMLIIRQHFLEDGPAAQLANTKAEPSMLFFALNMCCAGMLAAFALLFDGAVWGLLPAFLWAAFPFILPFLEQDRSSVSRFTVYMRDVLMRLARNTFAFFETAITERDHALPPESVQIEPNKGISHTSTPSAIGLYLCSLIAAEKLGLLPAETMTKRMAETVRTLEKLPKWHGLLYSLYDTHTLVPLAPLKIPSDECGILAVCLLTCAQGIRNLSANHDSSAHSLAKRMDDLCRCMQFESLYDKANHLFFTSIDPATDIPSESHYELLAGESCLLSFVSIIQNHVPVSHWLRLSRQQTARGILFSQFGSMVEYQLLRLYHPLIPDTILGRSSQLVLKMQKRHRLGKAFGVSKSACHQFDSSLRYLTKPFGFSELALDPHVESNVLAPYASLLCLSMDAKGVFRNYQHMQRIGLEGPLGLFEAADFSKNTNKKMDIVRSHTVLHQGMILCSLCNALTDGYLSSLFSSLPCVQAYQLLLEEPFKCR